MSPDRIEIVASGFRVHPVLEADGGFHVAIVFEASDGGPPFILHLSEDVALATAGDLVNSIEQAKANLDLARRQ
jgi:hypothetical protein